MTTELRKGIYWVGHVDWSIRDFHGYLTDRGSTYNSYLIVDEKIALIDTVKAPYSGHLLEMISEIVDPARIDYVVCNHAEPDHAGGITDILKACPRAELVCNAKCLDTLRRYQGGTDWKIKPVSDGQTLSLGRNTLQFIDTPMAHWPESMFTYVAEEKLLFSMDVFGQHYATVHRFDDQDDLSTVMAEARTYYANIIMLYGKQVTKVLDRAAGLPIEMIAPSHGLIWRNHVGGIIQAYRDWSVCKPLAKVVVLYDSMWGSTEAMALAIVDGAALPGVTVKLLKARTDHITVQATEVLDAACLAVGTPTLNMGMMPEVAAGLIYLKGLRPIGKIGFAFGSYGWGKNGAQEVADLLKQMKVDPVRDPLLSNYAPDAGVLAECRAAGRMLGERALAMATTAG
jgi:flavorubredoxin